MELIVDIGNTDIKFVFFKGETIVTSFRISSKNHVTTDELEAAFLNIISARSLEREVQDVKRGIYYSVVSPLERIVSKVVRNLYGVKLLKLTLPMLKGIKWEYDEVGTLGIDRALGIYSAKEAHFLPAIVVSMGTATTIDIVDEQAVYRGGMILPGVGTTLKALVENTSRLPGVEIVVPFRRMGKSTTECMQNGLYYLHRTGIRNIVLDVQKEFFSGQKTHLLFSGGFASLMNFEEGDFNDEVLFIHDASHSMLALHKLLMTMG